MTKKKKEKNRPERAVQCRDCHWYLNPIEHGKTKISCRDLGVEKDEPACDHFSRRLSRTKKAPRNVRAQRMRVAVGSLTFPDHANVFREIIGERFSIERDLQKCLIDVDLLLKQQFGQDVKFEEQFLRNRLDMLLDFYILDRLCNALGLAAYREDIVKAEIARRMLANKSKKTE